MKLHTTCETLGMNAFIDCLVDKDYSGLVIEGEPTEEEIELVWNEIYQQYTNVVGQGQQNYTLVLAAEIERLNYKIKVVEDSVKILQLYKSDELVEILHQHGFNFPFNEEHEEQYRNDLNRVLNRLKPQVIAYEQKLKEFENIKSKEEGEPVSRVYFNSVLSSLSKFIGSLILPENITIGYFATTLNLYLKYVETINQKIA
jgi:hypothetical protein